MSKLKKADVEHVAKLANLPLDEKEVETFLKNMSEVIEYVEQLDEVDTENVEPTSQTTGLLNRDREDKINQQRVLDQETAISQAPSHEAGYFKVPMILTEKT